MVPIWCYRGDVPTEHIENSSEAVDMYDGCDCWGPDGSLDTKIDQIHPILTKKIG